MERTFKGSYVADTMTKGCDKSLWQPWHADPGFKIVWDKSGMTIKGTSTLNKRCYSGLTTRRLFPADACLSADLRIKFLAKRAGKFGTICHLCNVLLGDEDHVHGLPDNNGEVAFGRCENKSGWFFWYYNHMNENFHKWIESDNPRPVYGDETKTFHTLRVTYREKKRQLHAELLEKNAWVPLGKPVSMHKIFSNIELKIDCREPGIKIDSTYRNVRLYPLPSTHPIRIFAGTPQPAKGLTVRLMKEKTCLAKGVFDKDGIAAIPLKDSWVYPLDATLELLRGKKVIDTFAANKGMTARCDGIFPDDFYVANPKAIQKD